MGLAEIAPEIMGVQLPMLVRTYAELDYLRLKVKGLFRKPAPAAIPTIREVAEGERASG